MKLLNLSGPQDLMSLVIRRRWWIILPFVALSAGVVLITSILPRMYVSQSLIIIRPRDVPEEFVKDLIAGSTSERLSVISERVLSESSLNKVLTQFEDELPEFRELNHQDKIAKLRKSVDLQFSSGRLRNGTQLPVSSFRVTSQNRNPVVAQKIVKQLTEVFVAEDRKSREDNVIETASFLQRQVDDLAGKLAKSDAALKAVRSRRRNELPNQLESNLRRLETLTAENQALRRDRTNYVLAKSQLEQQMAETPTRISKPAEVAVVPLKDPKVEDYKSKLAELNALKVRYTDAHPDVRLMNLQLETLEKGMTSAQIEEARKPETPALLAAVKTEPETTPNPAYQNMERNLQLLTKQIENIDARLTQNDHTIDVYNQHVNNVPQGEQELTDVLRENNDLARQHQEMSAKLASARLSESAENQQKGAQFEIVDPASLPLTPTRPAKSSILIGGFTLSFLFSLSIALLVDMLNQKAWSPSDIAHLIGVKVLVEVPRISTGQIAYRTRRKRVGWLASIGVAGVAYAMGLYFLYAHQAVVLQQLDPLIQKLY